MESIINLLDHFTPEFLIIETALLVVIFSILVITWVYNKKKYQSLKHQIPAGVVKNYLDSIIQNSTALKSSLFRGGGLDVAAAGIPSVMPVGQLGGGDSVAASGNPEELAQKNAEIANLRAQLQASQSQVKTLEVNLKEADGEIAALNKRIQELENALKNAGTGAPVAVAAAPSSGGDDSALKAELAKVTKERDELMERLKEYEIIEDDLANLKRLQQENEQLKKALAGAPKGAATAAPAAAPTPEPAKPAPAAAKADPGPEPIPEAKPAPAAAAGEEVPNLGGTEGKSPEDLLSEFEKMLG